MNKKLKIYSTLFVVILVIKVFTSTFHYSSYTKVPSKSEGKLEFVDCPPEFMSRDTLPDGAIHTFTFPTISYEMNVQPLNDSGQKVLVSKVGDQTCRIDMQRIKLHILPSQAGSNVHLIVLLSAVVVAFAVFIWILCLIVKLIISIRRGEVFITKVSRYLETAGILLFVLELYAWIVGYFLVNYFINHFHIPGYYIVSAAEDRGTYLLIGLALMVISQIILLGKDMKEEQELTI